MRNACVRAHTHVFVCDVSIGYPKKWEQGCQGRGFSPLDLKIIYMDIYIYIYIKISISNKKWLIN